MLDNEFQHPEFIAAKMQLKLDIEFYIKQLESEVKSANPGIELFKSLVNTPSKIEKLAIAQRVLEIIKTGKSASGLSFDESDTKLLYDGRLGFIMRKFDSQVSELGHFAFVHGHPISDNDAASKPNP